MTILMIVNWMSYGRFKFREIGDILGRDCRVKRFVSSCFLFIQNNDKVVLDFKGVNVEDPYHLRFCKCFCTQEYCNCFIGHHSVFYSKAKVRLIDQLPLTTGGTFRPDSVGQARTDFPFSAALRLLFPYKFRQQVRSGGIASVCRHCP